MHSGRALIGLSWQDALTESTINELIHEDAQRPAHKPRLTQTQDEIRTAGPVFGLGSRLGTTQTWTAGPFQQVQHLFVETCTAPKVSGPGLVLVFIY